MAISLLETVVEKGARICREKIKLSCDDCSFRIKKQIQDCKLNRIEDFLRGMKK